MVAVARVQASTVARVQASTRAVAEWALTATVVSLLKAITATSPPLP